MQSALEASRAGTQLGGFLLRPTEPYPSLLGATWGLRRATWIPGEATWKGDPAESAGLGNPDSGSESRAAGRGSLVRSPAPPGLRLGRCLVTGLGSLPVGRFGRHGTAAANRAPASGRIRPRRGLGFPVRQLPFRSVSRFAPMPLEAHTDLAVGSSSLQITKIATGGSVAVSHDAIFRRFRSPMPRSSSGASPLRVASAHAPWSRAMQR